MQNTKKTRIFDDISKFFNFNPIKLLLVFTILFSFSSTFIVNTTISAEASSFSRFFGNRGSENSDNSDSSGDMENSEDTKASSTSNQPELQEKNNSTIGSLDNNSNETSEKLDSRDRPVIIIAHGMLANGRIYRPLAERFRSAGYDVLTPSSSRSAFTATHIIRAANSTGNRKVILIGHSAGGAASQRAAAQLGDKVIGVISIDGAPVVTTNPNIPHAFFAHEEDGFGALVGNLNPRVPQENILYGGVVTLPGGHLIAPFGSDAHHYIEAAEKIEALANS